MSSISAKPKPEDVTNKPKVTVATVKPNIHRIKADQENAEQLTPDDAVLKKRRLSPAMLKRSLTKVKEIDSEDDHPDASGADKDDPKREKVASKKKEGADEDDLKREKVASKKKEGADEDDLKREKVASKKKEGADKDDPKREKVASKKKDADREDPEGENDHFEKLEDSNEEKSRKSKVKTKKTEDSDDEKSKGSKMQSKKTEDADGEIVSYEAHGEILHRGKKKSPPASVSDPQSEDHQNHRHRRGGWVIRKDDPQSEDHQNHRHRRGGWVIRKDDEFFHFIVACFAIGAVLICEHRYGDWTVSAGIGLLVFASLETIGIYFGFVTRIRAVLEGFLPLFQRSALPGFSNKK